VQVQRFLEDNDETSKLRQRQALVDLQGFSLAHEASLQGVFGVRKLCSMSCIHRPAGHKHVWCRQGVFGAMQATVCAA
jgi:hypothetical protein